MKPTKLELDIWIDYYKNGCMPPDKGDERIPLEETLAVIAKMVSASYDLEWDKKYTQPLREKYLN